MLYYLCAVVVLYIPISPLWPDAAIARIERQAAVPVAPPPSPTYGGTQRARVLALGRFRDGSKRHPILDTPWMRVADRAPETN